jgi:hypothetical protein
MTSQIIIAQIEILLWKRYVEVKGKPWDFFGSILATLLLLLEIYLLYIITPSRQPGSLEVILFPVIITSYSQKLLSQIIGDKVLLLIESMRIAGLSLPSYFISYFTSDGLILGIVTSFICSVVSAYFGLFNNASFLSILFTFIVSILGNVSFALCFSGLFDSLRASSIAYTLVTVGE